MVGVVERLAQADDRLLVGVVERLALVDGRLAGEAGRSVVRKVGWWAFPVEMRDSKKEQKLSLLWHNCRLAFF